jgi:outer membrane protein
MIVDYAKNNGFALIIDASTNNQWPNGPVLWNSGTLDITKPVVDAYNAKSGVPAPVRPAGATGVKPTGSAKPSTPGATKPSTTAPTKPSTTPPTKQ